MNYLNNNSLINLKISRKGLKNFDEFLSYCMISGTWLDSYSSVTFISNWRSERHRCSKFKSDIKKVKLSCAILVILKRESNNLNKAFLRTSKANKIRSALFSCFAKLLNRSADEVNCLPLVASKHTSVSLKRDPLTSAHTTLLAK